MMYPEVAMLNNPIYRTAAALLFAAAAWAQAPAARPSFEVATVKLMPPLDPAAIAKQLQAGKLRVGVSIDAARVDIAMVNLQALICVAYKVKPHQITGPSWITQDMWEILGKIPAGGTKEQVPEMLQSLLEERFKLAIHRESKEQNVYALVVGKDGHKLKPAVAEDPAAPPEVGKDAITVGSGDSQMKMGMGRDGRSMVMSGAPGMGTMRMAMGSDGTMRMEISKMPVAGFAEMLTRFVDRPVVDMTELKGDYQMTLELTMQDLVAVARAQGMSVPGMPAAGGVAGPADAASDPSTGSIFQSIQKLGLKLEGRKSPIEMIVIDRLEKAPTEN